MDSLIFYYRQIPSEWLWCAINVAFGLLFFVGFYLFYYCVRRGLGHEKFKGTWYRPDQLQKLKQVLYEGIREGRLPDRETMRFLDRHIYGKEQELRKINGTNWL